MDIIYFIVKYIPFWSIPLILISVSFSLFYKDKEMFRPLVLFIFIGSMSFIALCYWVYAGGHEKSVKLLISLLDNFSK